VSTLLTVRQDLADQIAAIVGDPVVVYPYPAEAIALPAVVILPDEPYWTPAKFGQGATAGVRVNFEVQLIVTRSELELGFTDLEQLAIGVGTAITAGPTTFRWADLAQPQGVEVNDIPCLMAGMAVTAMV